MAQATLVSIEINIMFSFNIITPFRNENISTEHNQTQCFMINMGNTQTRKNKRENKIMFLLLEKEKILNRTSHFCACEMKNSTINLKNKNLYNSRNMNSVILDLFHNQIIEVKKELQQIDLWFCHVHFTTMDYWIVVC